MKIVVLLFASLFGFGLAGQETVRVKAPEQAIAKAGQPVLFEAPVMEVLLDTVEITVSADYAGTGI